MLVTEKIHVSLKLVAIDNAKMRVKNISFELHWNRSVKYQSIWWIDSTKSARNFIHLTSDEFDWCQCDGTLKHCTHFPIEKKYAQSSRLQLKSFVRSFLGEWFSSSSVLIDTSAFAESTIHIRLWLPLHIQRPIKNLIKKKYCAIWHWCVFSIHTYLLCAFEAIAIGI